MLRLWWTHKYEWKTIWLPDLLLITSRDLSVLELDSTILLQEIQPENSASVYIGSPLKLIAISFPYSNSIILVNMS